MKPYLPWVFGEPDESGAMDSLINTKYSIIKGRKQRREYFSGETEISQEAFGWVMDTLVNDRYPLDAKYRPHSFYQIYGNNCDKNVPDIITQMDWDKDYMFRMSNFGTVEFRFMEMTPTWEEQELQINFVMKYIHWVDQRLQAKKETKVELITDGKLQKLRRIDALNQFNQLCSDIGVNPSDYQVFVDRNLTPRWRQGRYRR